jgi:hypothetical protein
VSEAKSLIDKEISGLAQLFILQGFLNRYMPFIERIIRIGLNN